MEKFNGKMCPLSIDDADNAYSYMPDVSFSSSLVYGIESFKEELKETLPSVSEHIGRLMYKGGKTIDKYFPDGIKLFNGSLEVKVGDKLKSIGDTLVNNANRQIEILEKEYKKKNPRLEKAAENVIFDVGRQFGNWSTMLLSGTMSPTVMYGLVLGGEEKERAEKYKQEHGGSLEGYTEQTSDDAIYNDINAFVQGVEEKYLGTVALLKTIKGGTGVLKSTIRNAVIGGLVTEPGQDMTDFVFDKIDGFNENEELKDRLKNNLRGYAVAMLFEGAGGFAGALAQRSDGIDMYKEALKNTVPAEDLEKTATAAYERDAKTLQDIVVVELENSSSLQSKRGEVYEKMYNETLQAVKEAKSRGAYSELETEEDIAEYTKAVADDYANWTLEEANRRNTIIQEVINENEIKYDENGLVLPMTKGINLGDVKKQQDILTEKIPESDDIYYREEEGYHILPSEIKNQELNILKIDDKNVKTKSEVQEKLQKLIDLEFKETTKDEKVLKLINKVYGKGKPTKKYKVARHIAFSSKTKQPEIRNNAVFDIENLIKNSVFVEEDISKQDKKGYDKALRFYTAIKAGNDVYPVRLVALHKENTGDFDLSGNVYDIIFEEKNRKFAKSPSKESTIDTGANLPDKIMVSDLLDSVKASDGKFYKQTKEFNNLLDNKPENAKGLIDFVGDKALIGLTEKADSTTLPHELAHYYLQNTFLYAKSGLATPEYKSFYNSIAKYLNITPDQENIKEWQQEKFARANELYHLGRAPEGMEAPLTAYNKWLRKVYNKVSEPMYKDENGELKVADIPYETMKTFAELTGQTLPEQEYKQNQEKVRGLAKTTSEMAKQKGIETETPMYEPRSSTEMGKKADEFIKNNKELAIDIVKGLAPEQDGLFRQDLFAALRELALNEGDSDLLNELSRSMTVEEATELGQRIQALARGRIDPVKQMVELRDERMKKNKVNKKKIKEETEKATKEIKKEIALAAEPKEWQDFVKSLEC